MVGGSQVHGFLDFMVGWGLGEIPCGGRGVIVKHVHMGTTRATFRTIET